MKHSKNENNTLSDTQKHHQHLEDVHHSSHKLGVATVLLLFGIFGIWSVFAELETTITANGKVITKSYNKIVMHPYGGIVKKIFVHEGDYVKKDQLLLELDNINYLSELSSNTKKLDENLFTLCRLKTEEAFEQELDCSEYEKKILDRESLLSLSRNAQSLFASDIKYLQAKENLLRSKNTILNLQNNSFDKQISSNKKLLSSYTRELKKWNILLKADAINELQVIKIQRLIIQVEQQISTLESKMEGNIATITSNEIQINLERESFKNRALNSINELELENQLINNTVVSLKNSIHNSIIRSPSNGIVTDIKIHASGEVVTPQKPIISIVPNKNKFIIEAYILPTDIEKVHKGQKAEVSFPAFVDPSAIPIEGNLTYVSADVVAIEGLEGSVYRALIMITPKGLDAIKKNKFKIVPGMPSAVFIQTGKKTLATYLLHPIMQMFKGIYHAN